MTAALAGLEYFVTSDKHYETSRVSPEGSRAD